MRATNEFGLSPEAIIRRQLFTASKIKSLSNMNYQERKADAMQIAVADNLIRYLTDADVCNLINSVLAGDKDKVFSSVEKLIDESVNALIELEQED